MLTAARLLSCLVLLAVAAGCSSAGGSGDGAGVAQTVAGLTAADPLQGYALTCSQSPESNEELYIEFGCSIVDENGTKVYPALLRALLKIQWDLFLDDRIYKSPLAAEIKMGADKVWLLPMEVFDRPGRIAATVIVRDQDQQILGTILRK